MELREKTGMLIMENSNGVRHQLGIPSYDRTVILLMGNRLRHLLLLRAENWNLEWHLEWGPLG